MKVLHGLSSYEGVRKAPGPRCGEDSGQSLLLDLLTSALREPFPCAPLSPGSANPRLEPREEQPQLAQVQSLGGWSCLSGSWCSGHPQTPSSACASAAPSSAIPTRTR